MGEQRVKEISGGEEEVKKPLKRKRIKKKLETANVYIKSTYNNTLVNVTDLNGRSVAISSAGAIGFKGAKKATPYAAQRVVEDVLEKLTDSGLREIHIFVKGIGSGREAAVRAFGAAGLTIASIKDVTPVPHNGCRPRKPRRV